MGRTLGNALNRESCRTSNGFLSKQVFEHMFWYPRLQSKVSISTWGAYLTLPSVRFWGPMTSSSVSSIISILTQGLACHIFVSIVVSRCVLLDSRLCHTSTQAPTSENTWNRYQFKHRGRLQQHFGANCQFIWRNRVQLSRTMQWHSFPAIHMWRVHPYHVLTHFTKYGWTSSPIQFHSLSGHCDMYHSRQRMHEVKWIGKRKL